MGRAQSITSKSSTERVIPFIKLHNADLVSLSEVANSTLNLLSNEVNMEVYFGSILHGNHTILLLLPETNQLTPEPNFDIRLHGFHLLIVIALFQLD